MENEKKTATSNAEMVTVSRAEYESQQAQLTELKLQNQWLLEQLGLAKKRQFPMAPEYGGSAGPDASTVPLADGGTEDRAAEGKQSGVWLKRDIVP